MFRGASTLVAGKVNVLMHSYLHAKMAIPIVDELTTNQRNLGDKPIDEDHTLWIALEAFRQLLPGKILPTKGRQHWNALIQSTAKAPDQASVHAGNLAEFLAEQYINGPRLLIGLPERSLILDGSLFINLNPIGLSVLAYLQKKAPDPADLAEIRRKAPGCDMDERTLRRAIAELEKQLNRQCRGTVSASSERSSRKRPRIRLIEARRGVGHWFLLPPQPVH